MLRCMNEQIYKRAKWVKALLPKPQSDLKKMFMTLTVYTEKLQDVTAFSDKYPQMTDWKLDRQTVGFINSLQ